MRTQIKCPQCASPVVADVYQILDVDQVPQFKQALLSGALNVAQCQNCKWVGQVAMPLVYHESAHDLLISFVPMELNLPYSEQERVMGQMVRQVVEGVPQEKRRAYLLQPQQMMRWQTFVERILQTEGITPEMISRQRKQSELLQTLMRADQDVTDELLTVRSAEIDETFISMVQSTLQQAVQSQQNEAVVIRLSNLQARLMRETEAGKRVEKRQLAIHALNQDAKAANAMTPKILLKHVLRNRDDDEIIDTLVGASGALSYEFFAGLSTRIDEAVMLKDRKTAERLTAIRTRLLRIYDEMRAMSEKAMQEARKIINAIASAPDKQAAIQEYALNIDDLFVSVLEQEIELARKEMDLARSASLGEIKQIINMAMTPPPELQLISTLLQMQDEKAMEQVLDENAGLVSADLLAMFEVLQPEVASAPQELQNHFAKVRSMVSRRVLT